MEGRCGHKGYFSESIINTTVRPLSRDEYYTRLKKKKLICLSTTLQEFILLYRESCMTHCLMDAKKTLPE